MDAPRLRLALPQADGGLLLDFEHEERRSLDAETMSVFGLTLAGVFADADAMHPDAVRTTNGDRASASLLYAASQPAMQTQAWRNALRLARIRTSTGGIVGGGAPREIDVTFYPFARTAALSIDDVIGAGMAADGYRTEIGLDAAVDDELIARLLCDAGADWVLDALKACAGLDESEHARTLLRTAWARGIEDLLAPGAPPVPVAPAIPTHASAHIDDATNTERTHVDATRTGQGWWAPPGGEERWFETSNYHFMDLAADIAAVALRMHENRERDGVPGATDILLLPFGSNYKLRMIWFEPHTSEALGGDEYVIVLHDDGDESFDADDFEHTCRDAGQYAAEAEGYAGPRLHFRWEWGGDHWPLG